MYTPGEFSKMINVTIATLRRWHKIGKLIPIVLESGHRRYTDEHLAKVKNISPSQSKINVVYCRESTRQQSHSLDDQEKKLIEFCRVNGLTVDKVIKEFGSAMNYRRSGLNELIGLINSGSVGTLVIYYKDRLVRFGFELIEHLCSLKDVKLVIIDNSETTKSKEEEFAEDLISIIHYFSMRLYGSRSYKRHLKENLQ